MLHVCHPTSVLCGGLVKGQVFLGAEQQTSSTELLQQQTDFRHPVGPVIRGVWKLFAARIHRVLKVHLPQKPLQFNTGREFTQQRVSVHRIGGKQSTQVAITKLLEAHKVHDVHVVYVLLVAQLVRGPCPVG